VLTVDFRQITGADLGFYRGKGLADTIDLRNQRGMPTKWCNLIIGTLLKTVTPEIPAVPKS